MELQPFIDLDAIDIPEDLLELDGTTESTPQQDPPQETTPLSPLVPNQVIEDLGLDTDTPTAAADTHTTVDSGAPLAVKPLASRTAADLLGASKRKNRPASSSPCSKRLARGGFRPSVRSRSAPPQAPHHVSSFLELSPKESLPLLGLYATDKDRLILKDKSKQELHALISCHLFKLGAMLESVTLPKEDTVCLRTIVNQQAKELESLRDKSKAFDSEKDLQKGATIELLARIASLEDELNRLRLCQKDELSRQQMAHLEAIEELKGQYAQQKVDFLLDFQREMKSIFSKPARQSPLSTVRDLHQE